jgi:hypothetical protein
MHPSRRKGYIYIVGGIETLSPMRSCPSTAGDKYLNIAALVFHPYEIGDA